VPSYEIQQQHNVLAWLETENGDMLCRNIRSYRPVNTINTLQDQDLQKCSQSLIPLLYSLTKISGAKSNETDK